MIDLEVDNVHLLAWKERGESGAFETLVRPWLPSIRRMVYLQVGNDAELFDEVQSEVLVGLMTALRQFNGASTFRTFLFTIVRRKAIDAVRRRQRRRREPLAFMDVMPEVEDGRVRDPAQGMITAENLDRLTKTMAKLPELDRTIIHLRLVESLSEKGAAQILGMNVLALRSRFNRARNKIKNRLAWEENP